MPIRQDYQNESIDPASAAATQLGPVTIHRYGGSVYAKLVTALAGADDVEFNVNLDGNALFSATQSFTQSGVFQDFVPDQNRYASGQGVGLEFEVTDATSGASISTLFASVLLETDDE